jgi:hypothetical protein
MTDRATKQHLLETAQYFEVLAEREEAEVQTFAPIQLPKPDA